MLFFRERGYGGGKLACLRFTCSQGQRPYSYHMRMDFIQINQNVLTLLEIYMWPWRDRDLHRRAAAGRMFVAALRLVGSSSLHVEFDRRLLEVPRTGWVDTLRWSGIMYGGR